jgi:hypothetical protein
VSNMLYMPADHQAAYDAMLQWTPPKGAPAYVFQNELAAIVYSGKAADWTCRRLATRWGMGWDKTRRLIEAWFDWHRSISNLKKAVELVDSARDHLLSTRGPRPSKAPAPGPAEEQDGNRTGIGQKQDGQTEEVREVSAEVRTGTGREQDGLTRARSPVSREGVGTTPQPPSSEGGAERLALVVPLRGGADLLSLGLPGEVHQALVRAGVLDLDQLRERYSNRYHRSVHGLSKRRWAAVEDRCQAAGVDLGQPVPRSASSPWIDRAVQGWGALLEAFMAHIGGTPLGMDFMAYVETLVIDDVTDDGTARLVCTSPHLKAVEVDQHLVGPLMDVLSGIPDVLGVEVRQMDAVDLTALKQAEQAGRASV